MATKPHSRCPETLRESMAPCEVTVSTSPPLVAGLYTVDAFVCPHGTAYWIEPTGEQIAQWAASDA